MVSVTALALAGAIIVPSAALAQATPGIKTEAGPASCADFHKNSDGAWTPVKDITVYTDNCSTRVAAGSFSFQPGLLLFCNADVGSALNRLCGSK
jgi:hypothetical protein